MSDLGLQFVLHARRVQLVNEQPPVIHAAESSFMKFCSYCFEIMPHVRKEDYSECSMCGLKTFPKTSESGRGLP